jgi:hypothetical protein
MARACGGKGGAYKASLPKALAQIKDLILIYNNSSQKIEKIK